MPRRSFEEPFVNLSLASLKIVTNLDCIGTMVRVAQIAAVRCIKTGMSYRELKKATGLQNAISLREHPIGFRNIHQAHKGCGKIKSRISKWQVNRARHPVIDTQRRFFFNLLRVSDED